MRTARVTVLPYTAAWKAAFEAVKAELEAALGDLILGIEHVGSTSVEGLCAKPCIDIDVIIEDVSALSAVIACLESIGYFYEGDLGIPGREAFGYLDKPHLEKHHLYVCPKDSEELRRHLVFRDYLRSHPAAANAYGRAKQMAAERYPDDIDGYIACKSPCIEEIYAACGLQTDNT